MSRPLKFSPDAIKSLILARNLIASYQISCITPFILLVSINSLDDIPLRRHLLNKGFDSDTISNAGLLLIHKYLVDYEKPDIREISSFKLEINNGEFSIHNSVLKILNYASVISQTSYNKEEISCNELLASIAETYYSLFNELMINFYPKEDLNSISSTALTQFDEEQIKLNEQYTLPADLSSFLTVINKKFSMDEEKCHILGREKETEKLQRILSKTTKRNAVLVGNPGVGKTAIVEMLTWSIVTGNCPSRFKNHIVISLDVTSIIAGTQYRGTAEERFKSLILFLEKNPNCILFIDEIHLLLGAGACKDGELDLANALKPILARGDTQIIGATTFDEYEKYFSKDGALKRRFEKVIVSEPKNKDVYPMIKNQIERLEKAHKVTISKKLVEFIILYASCFNYETQNPDRTLDLLDKSMANAELNERKEVTSSDVLVNFSVNLEKFQNMSQRLLTSTAYHEAGHCLMQIYSKELVDYEILAVSILPAEGYLGVNVYDSVEINTPSCSKQYYIELIGRLLGGRIAEKMYSTSITSGASSDLRKATGIAKDLITKYGLDEGFTENRVYLRDSQNPMYNEEVINKINVRIDVILDEAKQYAESILYSHKKELSLLATALLTDGIVTSEDISKILDLKKHS